jgi:hypothetical protein
LCLDYLVCACCKAACTTLQLLEVISIILEKTIRPEHSYGTNFISGKIAVLNLAQAATLRQGSPPSDISPSVAAALQSISNLPPSRVECKYVSVSWIVPKVIDVAGCRPTPSLLHSYHAYTHETQQFHDECVTNQSRALYDNACTATQEYLLNKTR